jgi:hypothetical protein
VLTDPAGPSENALKKKEEKVRKAEERKRKEEETNIAKETVDAVLRVHWPQPPAFNPDGLTTGRCKKSCGIFPLHQFQDDTLKPPQGGTVGRSGRPAAAANMSARVSGYPSCARSTPRAAGLDPPHTAALLRFQVGPSHIRVDPAIPDQCVHRTLTRSTALAPCRCFLVSHPVWVRRRSDTTIKHHVINAIIKVCLSTSRTTPVATTQAGIALSRITTSRNIGLTSLRTESRPRVI